MPVRRFSSSSTYYSCLAICKENRKKLYFLEKKAALESCFEFLQKRILITPEAYRSIYQHLGSEREFFENMLNEEFGKSKSSYWLLRIYDAYNKGQHPFAVYLDQMVDDLRISSSTALNILQSAKESFNGYTFCQALLGMQKNISFDISEIHLAYKFLGDENSLSLIKENDAFQAFDYLLKKNAGMNPPLYRKDQMLERHFFGFPHEPPSTSSFQGRVSSYFHMTPEDMLNVLKSHLYSKSLMRFTLRLLSCSFTSQLSARLLFMYKLSHSYNLICSTLKSEKEEPLFETILSTFLLGGPKETERFLERTNLGEESKHTIMTDLNRFDKELTHCLTKINLKFLSNEAFLRTCHRDKYFELLNVLKNSYQIMIKQL